MYNNIPDMREDSEGSGSGSVVIVCHIQKENTLLHLTITYID